MRKNTLPHSLHNTYYRFIVCLLVLLAWSEGEAQSSKELSSHLNRNQKPADHDSTILTDSLRWAAMEGALMESRLNEANLRLEIEQMKQAGKKEDSIRQVKMRLHIDSLRSVTTGAPVVVDGDTLLLLYAKSGGWTPHKRAEMASEELDKLGRTFMLQPDSVYVETTELLSDIMYGQKVLLSFSDRDALWAGCVRDSLAAQSRDIIVEKLKEMKKEHGLWQLIRRTIQLLLTLIGLFALFYLINKGKKRVEKWLVEWSAQTLQPFYLQNVKLLDTAQQTRILMILLRIVHYFIILVTLMLTVPLLFSLFPQTKDLAYKILYYIGNPVYDIVLGVVTYIPNLFTIFIICTAIHYLVRLIRYFAHELEEGRLEFNGFYPDWAMPTFYIIRFLLYAFMVAMIYPYLPGANSGFFQGISVFLGLIVSLGSSTVIGNIIAGLVITYMRPFKLGDRIKLNDTTGNVIEKTPLVTRIRTPKNEVVTIPNSFLMSSQTVNYSQSAREFGLIIHTEVTIGYDAPWRQVHELLINAALNTPGVVDDPRPFVLETSLSDWYPVYQLNAYIHDADRLGQIYSDLHQNIQDSFNKAGVEIMSPHYMATRDGNESTIPKDK